MEKVNASYAAIGGIADNAVPGSSARVCCGVPVALSSPLSAASGIEKGEKGVLLDLLKKANNGEKQGGEEEKRASAHPVGGKKKRKEKPSFSPFNGGPPSQASGKCWQL